MRMSPADARRRRDQLVTDGYTVVAEVFGDPLLRDLRIWTNTIFERQTVDPRFRYQGSDFHAYSPGRWAQRESRTDEDRSIPDPIVDRFLGDPALRAVGDALQLEGLKALDSLIILSKPPHGPPLYWHQDFMNWNSPAAATPWPTRISLSTYLTDTSVENGCLRVIPGTHRRRIDLHDHLPDAHGAKIQAIDDLSHPAFTDHPDAVDVELRAGDLVVADARLLHGARPNTSDAQRTLVLAWHDVFPFPDPPSWWTGPIPEAVRTPDTTAVYESSRTPGAYLR